MGDRVVVVEEVFGGAGGFGVVDVGGRAEVVVLGQLIGGLEGELDFAGTGFAGEEEGASEHVGDFEGV